MLYFSIVCLVIIIYIFTQNKLGPVWRLVFKMLASFALFAWALSRYLNEGDGYFEKLLLVGLGFGVIGDFLLGLRPLFSKKRLLLFGGLAFLFGHIAYFWAFYLQADPRFLFGIIPALGVLLIYIRLIQHKSYEFGRWQVPFYAYLFVLFALTSFAFVNQLMCWFSRLGLDPTICFLLSFLFFTVSDLVLFAIYFKKLTNRDKKVYRIISASFYYCAQLLIAFLI